MVQTIGSAGESLAAGAIFTLPALFMWAQESDSIAEPTFITIALIALCGGILGVFFMIPLRTALIVEEHGVLPFPEGQACAEVLLAGEEGGENQKLYSQDLAFRLFINLLPMDFVYFLQKFTGSFLHCVQVSERMYYQRWLV